ncbi:MAG: polysaccharide deacetylase family protein [Kangiellaceae bacterium]|nr:polysaccharide deacetylase family protein [Kangiellaceae bacterium]
MTKHSSKASLFYSLSGLMFGLFLFYSDSAHSLVVAQYHHISNETPHSTSLSPEVFKQHLDYLKRNNFKVLDLETVISKLKNGQEFPDKSILITFDDGYRSIYEIAFPLLKKYKFPFTVFVNTKPIEKGLVQYMSWIELQELIDYGASIANHSVSHPHLIRSNLAKTITEITKTINNQVVAAQETLEHYLTKSSKAFAYPYGEYEPDLQDQLELRGYIAFGQHSGAVSRFTNLQAIPRFPFGGRYGALEDFKLKINSLPAGIKKTLLLDKHGKRLGFHLLPNKVTELKLKIVLDDTHTNIVFNCYGPNGKELKSYKQPDGSMSFEVKSIPVFRSRINCTAPSSNKKRFHWFSQPIIRANSIGNLY